MDKLTKAELDGYHELTQWIVVCEGEGVQAFASRDEAIADAKEQADATPNLILGLYRLDRYVCARVAPAQLFAPGVSDD